MPTVEMSVARVVAALQPVPGIMALALGGSRATGTHTDASDVDIGIYYDAATFDIAALRTAVMTIDDLARPDAVTPRGGWGPWVDGGGWLTVDGQAVDVIYRDLERVRISVVEAVRGDFTIHPHWGHPHGIPNTLYAAEVAICQTLWEREGVISTLKPQLSPYPPHLSAHIIAIMLDEAGFFVSVAQHGLPRGDVSYAAGCAFRVIACLMQALYAVNGRWLLNEKGAVAGAARLPNTLPDVASDVAAVYAAIGAGDLDGGVRHLQQLEHSIRALISTAMR